MDIRLGAAESVSTTTGATVSSILSTCFNGNTATADYTNIGSGTQDFILDYGELKNISKVKWWMYYGDSRVFRNVALYGSTDNTNWDTLKTKAEWTSNSSGIEVVLETPTEYRYLKFYAEGNVSYNSNEYCEIEVYKEVAVTEDLALNKTAAADSYAGSYTPAKAVDGDDATRWASTSGSSDAWWSVDLEDDYAVAVAVLKWEAANASAYNIQYSDDNTNWTTAKSCSFSSGARTDIVEWEQETAHRYWRMDVVTVGAWGSSLYTVNLYALDSGQPEANRRRFVLFS